MKDTKERDRESMGKGSSFIEIHETAIHKHLEDMVRDTVEDTLNRMLEIEADQMCKATLFSVSFSDRVEILEIIVALNVMWLVRTGQFSGNKIDPSIDPVGKHPTVPIQQLQPIICFRKT